MRKDVEDRSIAAWRILGESMDHSYHKLITDSQTYALYEIYEMVFAAFAAFASFSWMSPNVDSLDSKVRS